MISNEWFADLTGLINYHLGIHDGVELRDVYKLLHQSVFGPEHLGEGMEAAAIEREMRGQAVEWEEPLLEPISVDGRACRVNLRVAARLGVAPSIIAEAVRSSAFGRDRGELGRLWKKVGESLDALSKRFGEKDFERLTALVNEKGFPPFHHSSGYRELNRPAYRVILGRELERVMRDSSARGLSP